MTKTVHLNGKMVHLPVEVCSVQDLLSFYHLENRIVVVEINKEITDKEHYQSTLLSDRDAIEIIHFVGGG
jgi:sulfur carrier protein